MLAVQKDTLVGHFRFSIFDLRFEGQPRKYWALCALDVPNGIPEADRKCPVFVSCETDKRASKNREHRTTRRRSNEHEDENEDKDDDEG